MLPLVVAGGSFLLMCIPFYASEDDNEKDIEVNPTLTDNGSKSVAGSGSVNFSDAKDSHV